MINIEIKQETIQESFQASLDAMLVPGNYHNPVKTVLDKILGYSVSNFETNPIGKQIKEFVDTQLQTTEFQAQLGKAIAEEMAKRAVDAMERKQNN